MVLATWLLQFYLSKCNELDDIIASESASQDVDNLRVERRLIEDDLCHFFEAYKVGRFIDTIAKPCLILKIQGNLHKETIYELIQGHGRTDMYLFYATTIGDHECVVEHWILEEEWVKAIEVISRQVMWYQTVYLVATERPMLVQPRTVLSFRTCAHAPSTKRNGGLVAATTIVGPSSPRSFSSAAATYYPGSLVYKPCNSLSEPCHLRTKQHIFNNSQPSHYLPCLAFKTRARRWTSPSLPVHSSDRPCDRKALLRP